MKMINASILAGLVCLASGPSVSLASEPKAGVHYQKYQETPENDRIVQFFSLGCHHCYRFEEHLDRWDKKASVQRMPVHFGKPQWVHYARVYFALIETKKTQEEVIPVLFEEIHKNRNRDLRLNRVSQLFDLDETEFQKFREAYRSDTIRRQVDDAADLAKTYKVSGVPALVIKGRYMTDAAMTRGIHGLLRVTDYLLDSQRQDVTSGSSMATRGERLASP